MKKAIKILTLAILMMFATFSFAQPPDPDNNPNTDGGKELGGNAPIGSGILMLSLFAGFYAVGKTYSLNRWKKRKS